MFRPLEKCVGHKFKTIGHSLKILVPSENYSPPLVSQAGYGPVTNTGHSELFRVRIQMAT